VRAVICIVLVVVCVLAVAALVVPSRSHGKARVAAAQTELSVFEKAIDWFQEDTGRYPTGGDALLALARRPRDIQNWHGPYLKSEAVIPMDPWGNPYIYKCPGRHNRNSYDLYSMGPDGREGTDDDVTNWQSQK
jgi:general secretion pathway protein G